MNPTGQQVTGLSSLARTECIPVAPPTQWHVVLLLEVGLCGFCQLPYNASIYPSLLTGTLISGLTSEEQDWHFLPPPTHSWPHSRLKRGTGFPPRARKQDGKKKKNYAWKRSGVLDRLCSDCFVWDTADHSSTATCTTINVEVLV